jgi:hypothetical protein
MNVIEWMYVIKMKNKQKEWHPATKPLKLLPVSTTPAANFATSSACVVDTGGKFAPGVNDAGGKLPPLSTTTAANYGKNIRLQTP